MGSNQDFALVAPGAEGFNPDHPAAAHCTVIDRDAGIVDLKGRKKIAICGFASSSRGRIPFDDPDWILAGINQLYRHVPRADVWFDIHLNWREDNVEGTDHPRWVKTCGIPFYMGDLKALAPESLDDYPTVVQYPVARLIEKHGLDYFTSTVAFMLAWAIDEIDKAVEARLQAGDADTVVEVGEVKAVRAEALRRLYNEYTIGVFGIDLIVGTEYECVAPDTKVLTADLRWTPAGMLSVGQQLVGFDEHGMREPGQRRGRHKCDRAGQPPPPTLAVKQRPRGSPDKQQSPRVCGLKVRQSCEQMDVERQQCARHQPGAW